MKLNHKGQDMDEEMRGIFPVPIQVTTLELNIDSLIEFCYEMKRKNEKGVEVSNIGGWQSDNIINETHTEFVKLKNKIEEVAKEFHEKIKFKKTLKQEIDNIWVNINQKGHSNDYHIHPYSILSGAFYLKGSTPIVFQHPFRMINEYYWPNFIIEEPRQGTSGEWRIEPNPNKLLIFPPWVWHKVSMNKEDIDRISFSFNTQIHETEKGNG